MDMKEQLQSDTAAAMRAGDTLRRDTLRLLLAAIKQQEVDQRTTLDDARIQAVLAKEAKQRRESIADAEMAGRPELAAREQAELDIVKTYLPKQLTAEEIRPVAAVAIDELGATGSQDIGRVLGKLIPQLKGKADGRLISDVVRQLLLD